MRQLAGPTLTGQFASHYTDLGIPVELADGTLLFIGGDTYPETTPASNNDWRSPVGLTSRTTVPPTGGAVIDGAITDRPGHAKGLVPKATLRRRVVDSPPPCPRTSSRVGNTLYMALIRGKIYATDHTDFWRSADNGNTWQYLRQGAGNLYGGQYQQKTYAANTSDNYVYVMSSVFNRTIPSGLLLFRLLKSALGKTDADAGASGFEPYYAYQPWDLANGRWAWGNQPTTITDRRLWGEICFRAMCGKYVLSWFQPNANNDLADIRAQAFPLPTSNLVATTEQTMIYNSRANPSSDDCRSSPLCTTDSSSRARPSPASRSP